MTILHRIVLAALLSFGVAPWAQSSGRKGKVLPDPGAYRVLMKGSGKYQFGDTPAHQIDGLAFVTAQGRSAYMTSTSAGLLGFSGDRDFQPSATDYFLDVDSILQMNFTMPEKTIEARGRCRMNQSEDGLIVYSVECSADTRFGKAVLSFTGDGTKIDLKR